jgi:hypothetical protein
MPYNIKNTKEVLDLAFAGGMAVKNALADGKIDLQDVGHLMPVIMLAGPALEDIALVPKEIGDLNAQEAQELMDYAKQKLDPILSDEALKAKINKGLKLGVSLAEFLIELAK